MKPHLDIHHEGTLGDDRKRMEFDPDSVAHLMSILTDLYSDPALAVIREYSTNALDSHIAAGQTRPVEVELPSSLRPLFVVRDFGVGMTVDQIINQFSKYGWSSKRDSDTAVGMLGLGCKSGLSYTSQFTMISVHDGVQVTVLVTREDDGAGAVQIIDTMTTDAPNGVEVQVPVSWVGSFNEKAEKFFRYWGKGLVLVNGAAPQPFVTDECIVLSENITLVPHRWLDHDVVVMGNVPYPIAETLLQERGHTPYRVVARVPIGAVDFTPSRESLHYTKRTKEAVQAVKDQVTKLIPELAQVRIDAAPKAGDAVKEAMKWRRITPRSTKLTYRGTEIPEMLPMMLPPVIPWKPDKVKVLEIDVRRGRASIGSASYKSSVVGSIAVADALEALHVVGFKGNGVTEATKRKICKYMVDNDLLPTDGWTDRRVLFYGPEFGSPWLDNVTKVQFADIQVIDLGDKAPERKKYTYRSVDQAGYLFDLQSLPTENVTWFSTGDGYHRQSVGKYCRRLHVTVISVPTRSAAKFERDHPEIPHLKVWAQAVYDVAAAEATDADRWGQYGGYGPHSHSTKLLRTLSPSRLLDKELGELILTIRSASEQRGNLLAAAESLCTRIGIDVPDLTEDTDTGKTLDAMCKRYPILDWNLVYDISRDHTHEIINALYLTRKLHSTACDLAHPKVGLHSSLVH